MDDAGDSTLKEELQRRLLMLQGIAPPSAMGQEILRVVTDEQADLEHVAATIEKYPELTARVLRCANSAYYGHRGEIYAVADAIIRVLGLSVTKALALSLTLESSFRLRNCPGFKIENYWFSAVLTANLARSLAPLMRSEHYLDLGAAYTVGLLHNIGLLALVELFPQPMSQVFAEPDVEAQQALMQSLLGMDVQQAGAVLGRRWGLPKPLIHAITYCRDKDHLSMDSPLLPLLKMSVMVADRLSLGEEKFDLPEELPGGIFDSSEVAVAVAQISTRIKDLRGVAQLLAGGRN